MEWDHSGHAAGRQSAAAALGIGMDTAAAALALDFSNTAADGRQSAVVSAPASTTIV